MNQLSEELDDERAKRQALEAGRQVCTISPGHIPGMLFGELSTGFKCSLDNMWVETPNRRVIAKRAAARYSTWCD